MLAVGSLLSGKVATADLPEIGRSNLLPIYREKKKSKSFPIRQSILREDYIVFSLFCHLYAVLSLC